MLAIYLGLSIPGAAFAAETPATQATPPPSSGESEIIFNGKLFCSLKRRVDLPFKGIITSLRVHSGQPVKAGDILATYRLAPEALMAIQQRLSPPQLAEAETKLAEVQRNMVPLTSKQRELSQLVEKKLAPADSLAQNNQQLQLLNQEKATLQDRLKKDRQLAHQDQEVLSDLLGTSLKIRPGSPGSEPEGPHQRLRYLGQPRAAGRRRTAPPASRLSSGGDGPHAPAGPGF